MKKEINGVRGGVCHFMTSNNDILGLGMCFLIFIDILTPPVCFLQPFCCFSHLVPIGLESWCSSVDL